MIVNLEESLYELEEAKEDVLVLKSRITGESEYWTPTEEADGVYLIAYKGKNWKFSESVSYEPKHATVNAIKALGKIKSPSIQHKACKASQALLSLLATLEEPILANDNMESGISAEDWLKIADRKGLWTALADIPYDSSELTRSPGALADCHRDYHRIQSDFLKLTEESDKPILDKLGNRLFDCILGECELEPELENLSPNLKSRLPGFRSEIENLKRNLLNIR